MAWKNEGEFEKLRALPDERADYQDQLNYQRSLFQQQQSSYQALNSQKIQQNIQLSQLRSDLLIRAADYDNQISQSESQRSELQRQLAESNAGDQVIIKAPLKGTIESLSVTAGQVVESGSSLAQIKPIENIKYYLVLWLPNNSLPYVKIGDGINIRYEAFPSDKFGQFPGRIESISSVPASPQEMAEYSSGNKGSETPTTKCWRPSATRNSATKGNIWRSAVGCRPG